MATTHLLEDFLPISSTKLGRLLLNPKRPQKQFIDPLHLRPTEAEISRNGQQHLQNALGLPKGLNIPPYLVGISPVSTSPAKSAPVVTSYDLKCPAAWLTNACSQSPVRQFLEDAFDNEDSVYLIIGFRTIQDPGTTGEQIFAVLYHKVQVQCVPGPYSNTVTLNEDNRWVSTWCWRGLVQQDELHEEDSILEATLMDLGDMDILGEEDCSTGDPMEWDPDLVGMGQGAPYTQRHMENSMKRNLEQNGAYDKTSKRSRPSSTLV